ncbi:DNA mismatch repair endonuclease MutL [Thalassotalea sp. HSM 43]|uniref:DNA mismatch repair endonuclease MutL n=1 Tax=Thalassotalea sp. HSM 43 TaxID=2552945 RepID=UPI001080C569|nr:DNA mismatch repair endonuclease MutL [Thalassotalea sp. HSM 43]QBY04655.1 DNA mismatch repair endonuclease MutL [Thalassotalea sp. HSM 43]
MTISILPARLANQIAAGEVVERPASVVKELVENAIDAGATKIVIDIEKGGSKRIRITDNGHGIEKDELTLALSRHATSKIKSLDDLEAIDSLGFRGEALASISSVSRLTLTSKPAAQQAAWQAIAVGRDMQVDIKPAAHPDGTTIDVEDLFFNTPARRKFLRTEKTEFSHIDEVIKRIGLSQLQLTLILNHNGKTIRSYRSAQTDKQIEKRIAAVCSQGFIDNALPLQYQHSGMRLWGWVGSPRYARNQNDLSYSYVNGRMMRDKLINHAIRQAYGHRLSSDVYPAFVLYFELNHGDVDVNVHPAKHEVRFHQARLVHDFIAAAVEQTLQDDASLAVDTETGELLSVDVGATSDAHGNRDYVQPLRNDSNATSFQSASTTPASACSAAASAGRNYRDKISDQAVSNYQKLMSPAERVAIAESDFDHCDDSNAKPTTSPSPAMTPATSQPQVAITADSDIKLFSVLADHVLLLEWQQSLYCCNFKALRQQVLHHRLTSQYPQGLVSQPLLLPVAVKLQPSQVKFIASNIASFEFIGVHLSVNGSKVVIRQYPAQLREQDISDSFIELLTILLTKQELADNDWMAAIAQLKCSQNFDLSMAAQLLADVNQIQNFDLFTYMRLNSKAVDLTSDIQSLLS